MVAVVPDQQRVISREPASMPWNAGPPGHLQPAITAQFTAGWGKDGLNLRPGHQPAGHEGPSNAGLLWHGRHGRAGDPRFGAPIASHLSNAPLRANAAKGVTGYDQATLLREWAVEALTLPSNRDHAHVDPTPSAPPSTPSAPGQVTVALATAAGGLRAHHRCPGRRGGLGHPAAPTGTVKPTPRPRAADRPDRASPEARVDAHHRAGGADQCAHPLDPDLSDRAGGRQRGGQRCWTGQRPSAGHGWPDHEHRGVLDRCRHQHPALGDRPDQHARAVHHHDRADDHGRPHHDHAGHHDQHRAPDQRADNDRCRVDQHHRVGHPVRVDSQQAARLRGWVAPACGESAVGLDRCGCSGSGLVSGSACGSWMALCWSA